MMASHSSVLFREIHKNAWLRKLPVSDKKSGATPKKGERVWTVFCVHDDTEPFLELYSDQKMATAHRPENTVPLAPALHISPTICPQDDEFEFVITLPSDLIRLTAPSWEIMMDWVDTMCSKLREMHILSPKENIYSRNPEARPPLLPTRDPNSPLPLPPSGSSSSMPGVEVAHGIESEALTDSNAAESSLISSNTQSEPENILSLSIPTSSVTADEVSVSDHSLSRFIVPNEREDENSRENVTVIEVSSEPVITSNPSVFDFSFIGASLDCEEELCTPPVTPVLSRGLIQRHHNDSLSSESPHLVTVVSTGTSVLTRQFSEPSSEGASPEQIEQNEESLYEHVFLSTPATSSISHRPLPSRGRSKVHRQAISDRSRMGESSGASHLEGTERFGCVLGGDRDLNDRRLQSRSSALQPPPQPFPRGISSDPTHRLTLREQQVLQLRKEMLHSGGVRLQLRRKDCISSIALVDAFYAVWVAGWKQRDHPMLYNALHIGDQLVSVAGILVQNANDAQRLIRGAPSLYVELIVRRIPCGRVYALRRDSEGQDLGIIQEGKTAEIREITPGSIAALGGMSSRTPTLDGQSLTNCVLTEINGRPLNLFFKDNEVRDRLNAVGLDISLLVQPLDLIKQIKKQLKCMKNYKDYIVQ